MAGHEPVRTPRVSPATIILAFLLALATVAVAICAYGWYSATRPKLPAAQQVKVVATAAYTVAKLTAATASGTSADSLDALEDAARDTDLTIWVQPGDTVVATVTSTLSEVNAGQAVGCKLIAPDGTTVLSEQSSIRGTEPAICIWRNA